MRLLAAWHAHVRGESIFPGQSFNLDFHSVPYYGAHPTVQKHFVFPAQPAPASGCSCFSPRMPTPTRSATANADLRKGDEPDEVFRFIDFWKRTHGPCRRIWSSIEADDSSRVVGAD